MNKDTTTVSELLFRGEALADYYQTKRDLALHNVRDILNAMSRNVTRACLELEETTGETVFQLEYISPVLASVDSCYQDLQQYYHVAKDSHEELEKLAK